jgi:hypothetical protein
VPSGHDIVNSGGLVHDEDNLDNSENFPAQNEENDRVLPTLVGLANNTQTCPTTTKLKKCFFRPPLIFITMY